MATRSAASSCPSWRCRSPRTRAGTCATRTSAAWSSCSSSPGPRCRSRRRGTSARHPPIRARPSPSATGRATTISGVSARRRASSWRTATCSRRTSRRRSRSPRGCGRRGPEGTLLRRFAAVVGDRLLEVFVFLAGDETDRLQRAEVLLGFRQVVDHQVGFAGVLVGAAVTRVELQRALVVLEGEIQLAGVAIRVAEVVLDVGVARVPQRGGGERPNGRGPVLRLDGGSACGEVGIDGRARVLDGGVGDRRRRQRGHEPEQRGGDDRTTITPDDHWAATRRLASCSSGRSLSALRVSRASLSKYSRALLASPTASAAFAAPYKPRNRMGAFFIDVSYSCSAALGWSWIIRRSARSSRIG